MKYLFVLFALVSTCLFISCENEPIGTANINQDIVDETLFSYLQLISEGNVPEPEIECIDFNYSFTVFVFDANMDFSEAVAVFNNQDLFQLLARLTAEEAISINYPISGTLSNGQLVDINTNKELKSAIEDCVKEEKQRRCNNTLIDCIWKIQPLDGSTNNYIGSAFKINRNGTVQFHHNSKVYFGTWVTLYIGDELFLNIDLNDDDAIETFWDFNWEIISFSENQISIKNNGTEILIAKDCSFPCTEDGYQVCEDEATPDIANFIFETYTTCIPVPPTHDVISAITYHFFETEEDALLNTNAIPSFGYKNTSNPQIIYVRIDYTQTGEHLELTQFNIEAVSCTGG